MTINSGMLFKRGNMHRPESSHKRGYNYRWSKYRKIFLKENPLCVFCSKMGKVVAANVVDHIEPHKGDYNLFWNKSNHQPLCTTCHQSTKQIIENCKDLKVTGADGWTI